MHSYNRLQDLKEKHHRSKNSECLRAISISKPKYFREAIFMNFGVFIYNVRPISRCREYGGFRFYGKSDYKSISKWRHPTTPIWMYKTDIFNEPMPIDKLAKCPQYIKGSWCNSDKDLDLEMVSKL